MSDFTPERIKALHRSARPGHYADCLYAADEAVCACWTECADGLAETLAALTAAAEREARTREALRQGDDALEQLAACAPYLKDSETPAECIERNRKDIDATLSLLAADRAALAAAAERETALREALRELRINANRLCDRNLGGTYEDDCRRSLKKAEAALGLTPDPPRAEP